MRPGRHRVHRAVQGFAACQDPAGLRAICDRLGPGAIQVFFEQWMSVLPVPLTEHDRQAGYWWELSMRQIEVSRTLVFDAPRRACAFFEALVSDNLDLGRPDSVELIFTGRRERRGRPRKEPPVCKTKVVTRDTEVTINAFYKQPTCAGAARRCRQASVRLSCAPPRQRARSHPARSRWSPGTPASAPDFLSPGRTSCAIARPPQHCAAARRCPRWPTAAAPDAGGDRFVCQGRARRPAGTGLPWPGGGA